MGCSNSKPADVAATNAADAPVAEQMESVDHKMEMSKRQEPEAEEPTKEHDDKVHTMLEPVASVVETPAAENRADSVAVDVPDSVRANFSSFNISFIDPTVSAPTSATTEPNLASSRVAVNSEETLNENRNVTSGAEAPVEPDETITVEAQPATGNVEEPVARTIAKTDKEPEATTAAAIDKTVLVEEHLEVDLQEEKLAEVVSTPVNAKAVEVETGNLVIKETAKVQEEISAEKYVENVEENTATEGPAAADKKLDEHAAIKTEEGNATKTENHEEISQLAVEKDVIQLIQEDANVKLVVAESGTENGASEPAAEKNLVDQVVESSVQKIVDLVEVKKDTEPVSESLVELVKDIEVAEPVEEKPSEQVVSNEQSDSANKTVISGEEDVTVDRKDDDESVTDKNEDDKVDEKVLEQKVKEDKPVLSLDIVETVHEERVHGSSVEKIAELVKIEEGAEQVKDEKVAEIVVEESTEQDVENSAQPFSVEQEKGEQFANEEKVEDTVDDKEKVQSIEDEATVKKVVEKEVMDVRSGVELRKEEMIVESSMEPEVAVSELELESVVNKVTEPVVNYEEQNNAEHVEEKSTEPIKDDVLIDSPKTSQIETDEQAVVEIIAGIDKASDAVAESIKEEHSALAAGITAEARITTTPSVEGESDGNTTSEDGTDLGTEPPKIEDEYESAVMSKESEATTQPTETKTATEAVASD